ncbi:hypothetical protein [Pseudostreptobacillus hongkongensis]|uniref:hypothetical protein n=1 Tax=Pseudostreptobacillus hongkongensis TaxID=1162717 RepID=UPI000835975C|nr:hypothetical protein [Pseudostreptobacillus hongkongensis]
MYTIEDEFEYEIDGSIEYFTCIAEHTYLGVEYLICESEDGTRRVFYYDNDMTDEKLNLIDDEEEEETILDNYQEELYKSEEKSFEYWEDNDYTSDYEGFDNDTDLDDEEHLGDDEMVFLDDYEEDEELDEFLDDLFDDEFEDKD